MDIIGRATIVLRIQPIKRSETNAPGIKTRGQKRAFEKSQPEELLNESYVLKFIWRETSEEPKGDIVEQLEGIYGVVQHVWHCDVTWPNKPGRPQYGMHLDESARVEHMLVCKNLTTIEDAVYMMGDGDECECSVINPRLEATSETRRSREPARAPYGDPGRNHGQVNV
ncbi:hypothetical protein FRC08_006223 [Ceratobasidium sp. 394]|nr:hypothetical protein FRC08_006223 [Ceratobasidium sp. 394]